MKVRHTGSAAETSGLQPSGPGRGPLQPSNGSKAPPAEPWGASREERRYGVPVAELGRRVAVALDEEDPSWGTPEDILVTIMVRAHKAEIAAWTKHAKAVQVA